MNEHAHRYQEELVQKLHALDAIRTADVESAFRSVPRHLAVSRLVEIRSDNSVALTTVPATEDAAVSDDLLRTIYEDCVLITHVSGQDHRPVSSSSRPSITAFMLEELRLSAGMSVLEIGAGTGYSAALLGRIVGEAGSVASVEFDREIAAAARSTLGRLDTRNVEVITGDGYLGHGPSAPYDRVVSTVGVGGFSPRWAAQLRTDGFMVAPVLHGGLYPLLSVRKTDSGRMIGRALKSTGFVPAAGRLHPHPRPWREWSVEQGLESVSVGPVPEFLRTVNESRLQDLWFALGVLTPGQVQQVGLSTAEGTSNGLGLTVRDDRVFLSGGGLWTNGAGGVDLVRNLFGRWADLGQPRITDWQCRLELDDALLIPVDWEVL
ncbi:protein-L-isoaspartate O-methyltransferase family protein [Nocardia terpenica]|uniref:Protein-L-isoaspartate O-methyltransferase n=1 Tax=Nocardia terpenica TaxID=455432 RepID=A0A6G9Z813_9NOCA|nr:rRNA adenine N-6-methyltransferase family protein [Nocardia terpenica]QIS21632.1 hypothetical protein F6W96_28135 [Nocardia terpenica]